jgi:hypothetical protein
MDVWVAELGAVELGVVDVLVVLEEPGVVELCGVVDRPGRSGDTHPAGAGEGTGCPGVTVPAQPMLDRIESVVTEPPSENDAADFTSRMNPAPSIETTSVVPS